MIVQSVRSALMTCFISASVCASKLKYSVYFFDPSVPRGQGFSLTCCLPRPKPQFCASEEVHSQDIVIVANFVGVIWSRPSIPNANYASPGLSKLILHPPGQSLAFRAMPRLHRSSPTRCKANHVSFSEHRFSGSRFFSGWMPQKRLLCSQAMKYDCSRWLR